MGRRRKYGFGNFLVDFTLTCLTGGLWFVWKFFRFLSHNT